MRKGSAFNIIPELVNDYSHVIELSRNPTLLYVDAAVKTLHTAADVFTAIKEHGNTTRKKETAQEVAQKYNELSIERAQNFQAEEIQKLDMEFEKVKQKLYGEEFQAEEVRCFIGLLRDTLKKYLTIFQQMPDELDYLEQSKVDDCVRKAARDYKTLLNIIYKEE